MQLWFLPPFISIEWLLSVWERETDRERIATADIYLNIRNSNVNYYYEIYSTTGCLAQKKYAGWADSKYARKLLEMKKERRKMLNGNKNNEKKLLFYWSTQPAAFQNQTKIAWPIHSKVGKHFMWATINMSCKFETTKMHYVLIAAQFRCKFGLDGLTQMLYVNDLIHTNWRQTNSLILCASTGGKVGSSRSFHKMCMHSVSLELNWQAAPFIWL